MGATRIIAATVLSACLLAAQKPAHAPNLVPRPLSFEPQGGAFVARGQGHGVILSPTEALIRLSSSPEVRLKWIGANPKSSAYPGEPLPGRTHYLTGSRPGGWRTGVPQFGRVEYRNVWPGVDLVYRGNEGRLEYDVIVAPGADLGPVRMSFSGVQGMRLDPQGELVLATADGELRQGAPVIYQDTAAGRRRVEGKYRLADNGQVGFEVAAYDRRQPLVIDPVLSYSSFLRKDGIESISSVAVDAHGNTYLAGTTALAGQAGAHAFVMKRSPAGTILYTTFLAGSGEDRALGVAVDAHGNAYVTGWTSSPNFPTRRALQDSLKGGRDAFAAKLGPAGELLYSSYLGGAGDDQGTAIAVDASGIYLTGATASRDLFTLRAAQSRLAGESDAFVVKLAPAGDAVQYATYLGGEGADRANAIAVDSAGRPHVAGASGGHAFAARLAASGETVEYFKTLAGAAEEEAAGIAVDAEGRTYVAGWTSSKDFPTAHPISARLRGAEDGFLARLTTDGALDYATYLGGSDADRALAVAVDAEGSAYVTGWTGSRDFPWRSAAPPSSDAPRNAFLVRVHALGRKLIYSAPFAGSDAQQARAVALDSDGRAVIAGEALAGALGDGFLAAFEGCRFELSSTTLAAAGGSQTLAVTPSHPDCRWEAESRSAWLTVAPGEAAGRGSLAVTAGRNAGLASRAGWIEIEGQRIPVRQESAAVASTAGTGDRFAGSCSIVATSPTDYLATGGTGYAYVDTSTCSPVVAGAWITVTAAPSGTTGTLQYTVAPNTGGLRSGTITLGAQSIFINQNNGLGCTYGLSATSTSSFGAGGGGGSMSVSASTTGCGLNPLPSVPWITVAALPPGTNGSTVYSVQSNTGAARNGSITLGTQSFTVSQSAGPAPSQGWVQKFPTPSPAGRAAHSMAYDSLRQNIVMFGGQNSSSKLSDTWTWTGSSWVQRFPAPPPGRSNAAMAYDEARGKTVMFGGLGISGGRLSDTWTWDGNFWSAPGSVFIPQARSDTALVYDAARQQVVMFGGSGASGPMNDTWVWDGTNWSQRFPATSPPASSGHSLGYHAATQTSILVRNGATDAWAWDGLNWSPIAATPAAPASPVSAYLATRQQLLVFSGANTWAWTGSAWTTLAPPASPAVRTGTALAFDALRGEAILFGGFGSYLNDTWGWTDLAPNAGTVTVTTNNAAATFTVTGPVTASGSGLGITINNAPPGSYTVTYGGVAGYITPPGQTQTLPASGAITFTGVYTLNCVFTLLPTSPTAYGTGGGSGSTLIGVTNPACGFTPTVDVPWITLGALPPGTSGALLYTVAANGGGARTGTMTLGTATLAITQAGNTACSLVATSSSNFPATGGTGYAIANNSACSPTVDVPWITLTALPPGTSGSLVYSVAQNTGAARTGTITMGSQSIVVNESAGAGCTYGLTATSSTIFGGGGGGGSATMTASAASCGLTPSSTVPWIIPAAVPPGTSGSTIYTVLGNPGAARNGTVSLGSQSFPVTQGAGPAPGQSWFQKAPATSPTPPRSRHGLAFDVLRQNTVMFGGINSSGRRNDTWVWDGSTWTQRLPFNSPSARSHVATAYSEALGQTVMFGGLNSAGSRLGETWTWDGNNWTFRPASLIPAPRFDSAMAYDAARQQVVLFGGSTSAGTSNDTWVWDGANWSPRFPATVPPPSSGHTMTYHAASQTILLVRNGSSDAWAWNGLNWSPIANTPAPPSNPVMTYLGARQQSLVFSGASTWTWNGSAWSVLAPPMSPAARSGTAMVYDAMRKEAVLFGGLTGAALNDTWTWSDLTAVTVQASVTGASFTVDGVTYSAPVSLSWTPGTLHTLSTTSPQTSRGRRYLFSNWSDGGAITHTVTAPSGSITYTANFDTQYLLTTNVSPVGAGGITSGGYFAAGTPVSILATPNAGYLFAFFSNGLTGAANPQTVVMNAPVSVVANFAVAGPALHATITARSGLPGARQWTMRLTNTGTATASNAQITGLTLTPTGALTCAPPVVTTPLPLAVGSIPASSSASGNVVINFGACSASVRFKVVVNFSANSGGYTGTTTLNNQFR